MPSFVAPLTTGVPTVSAGSATSCVTATTTEGAFCGWMSISEPYAFPSTTKGRIATTDPVDRRVDVAADRCADVERRRTASAELVPLRRAAAAAEDPVHDPRHESLVRLVPDRVERRGRRRPCEW